MHRAANIIMYKEEHIVEEILPLLQDAVSLLGSTSIVSSLCDVIIGSVCASMHPACWPLPSFPTTHMEIYYLLSSRSGPLM